MKTLLCVGYTLKRSPDFSELKTAEPCPGLHDLASVTILDARREARGSWKSQDRGEGSGKAHLVSALVSWITRPDKGYPAAFLDDSLVWCGFGIELFLDILRWEASLSRIACPSLIPGDWQPRTVDMRRLVLPRASEDAGVTLAAAVGLRGMNDESAADWKKRVAAWGEPGRNDVADAEMTLELSCIFRLNA